jgi:archaemetzincin
VEESYSGSFVNCIQVLPLGSVAAKTVSDLSAELAREFAVRSEILPPEPDPDYAFNAARQQFCSTEILAAMANRACSETECLLGVTALDLYIPILTFVFGEAQLHGTCAVVSYHRLHQEFYGLPQDSTLLPDRLLKESVHELGHILSLSHCDEYRCVMSPCHGVEWIDLKTRHFCSACRAALSSPTGLKATR